MNRVDGTRLIMRRGRRRARVAGITLIEAMIAITIMAIVASTTWAAFSQMTRNKARVERRLDRSHVAQMAMERMARELSMAYVSAHRPRNESLLEVNTAFIGHDHGGRDRIDFTSFSHQRLYRDAHESDQNELSYFVARHPEDDDVRVLARREQNRVDDDPTKGGRVEILVEGVESFDLQYLDPLSKEWVRTWDTTQATGEMNRLPAQVRIVLELTNPREGGDPIVYATRTSLPMLHGLNHAIYNP